MIAAKCPHCQAGIRAEDRIAGRVVACPKCKNEFQIPTAPQPNGGANPGVPSPRTPSAPSLQQRPVSQPNAQAVANKPATTDSGGGTSRPMLIAMIAIPVVAILVAATIIWAYEKSRQEARRQEAQVAAQKAQVAAQKIFDEAQQALGQNNIPEASLKLKAYLSDENATKTSEAKKLLAEIELATSKSAALDTVVAMSEEDFQRFQKSHHYDDARVTQPILAKQWDSALVSALPDAPKKREEENAKRLAELEKSKKEQAEREAVEAREARKNQTPTEQTSKPKKTDDESKEQPPKAVPSPEYNYYFKMGFHQGYYFGGMDRAAQRGGTLSGGPQPDYSGAVVTPKPEDMGAFRDGYTGGYNEAWRER